MQDALHPSPIPAQIFWIPHLFLDAINQLKRYEMNEPKIEALAIS